MKIREGDKMILQLIPLFVISFLLIYTLSSLPQQEVLQTHEVMSNFIPVILVSVVLFYAIGTEGLVKPVKSLLKKVLPDDFYYVRLGCRYFDDHEDVVSPEPYRVYRCSICAIELHKGDDVYHAVSKGSCKHCQREIDYVDDLRDITVGNATKEEMNLIVKHTK